MKHIRILFLILLLCLASVHLTSGTHLSSSTAVTTHHTSALRNQPADAVIVTDSDPFFGLLGTNAACWYDRTTNTTGLLPLLISKENNLTDAQNRFLETYLPSSPPSLLVLGQQLNTSYPVTELTGSPASVALTLALQLYTTAPAALILPYTTPNAYHLSMLATPLASYLNIPLLIYDNNEPEIQTVCTQLQVTSAYLIGNIPVNLPNITCMSLPDEDTITDTILAVIKQHFGALNYITMTNPSDVQPPSVTSTTNTEYTDHFSNLKLTLLSREIDIYGTSTQQYVVYVPEDTNRVQIDAEIVQKNPVLEKFSPIHPLLFLTLYDPKGHVVAYANSMGYDFGKTYVETLTCNLSGNYTLNVTLYHGIKGGYFLQRGFSYLNEDLQFTATISRLTSPHLPLIPNLSVLAPYLTAAHGGLLIANSSWELTDDSYETAAEGTAAGPWYTESLHQFTNEKVDAIVRQVNATLDKLNTHDLLNGYLQGPAWLALLADTTMIPMYYYGPSQQGYPDRGLPSDNPYSLNQSLSVGRLISWDASDASVLIARTFFYNTLCGEPEDWHTRFNFVFGEGFGETGGIFHQIPYAREIRAYGFSSHVYGVLRNGRQITGLLDVYTGANYIEYLGHGDWFWFPASLYGFDMYSKAVDVAHAKTWVFEKPSLFLSSACLMGRTDGLPPQMNIGLTMLHAGCNGFIGATRETGQEAGLTTLENHLIVDDWSLGEALRGEKQVDTEPPTFYVRTLYGDPAFNPYEPNNGFHDQGRPTLNTDV
ncbi:MAG: hypothetical protein JXA00_02870 [Candidatus Thermoplasmatota archaeon]|nr:hypothetical protein [Candidatus Thermoplasmatota archaeon]